jgi:hypothetical protein
MIIEANMNYNIILLCEVLLLNFIDWKLFLFSPTEMIFTLLNFLEVPAQVMPYLTTNIENYVNYVLSEYTIYSAFDLTVISISICKLALLSINKHSNPFVLKIDNLIYDLSQVEEVGSCVDLINKLLEESDEDYEASADSENCPSMVF